MWFVKGSKILIFHRVPHEPREQITHLETGKNNQGLGRPRKGNGTRRRVAGGSNKAADRGFVERCELKAGLRFSWLCVGPKKWACDNRGDMV
jgi:hypothetical protein